MDEYEPLIIEVTGINTNTSRDTLDNYFSSSKRGGDITNIEYNKGSGNASITFANAEGVKKTLETRPHSVEECTLTIRRKKAESDIERNRTEGIDMKYIKYAGTKNSETINAIATFHSPIVFDKIQEGLKKKPTLDWKHISIKTVPLCKTILVKDLPVTATHDSVLYRFENEKYGGGDVEKVHLDLGKRIALVEFKDPNVTDKVLSVKQTLESTILSVERYYPILGSLDLQLTERETSDSTRREVATVKSRHSLPNLHVTERITSDPTRRERPIPKPRNSLSDLHATERVTSDPTRSERPIRKPRNSLSDSHATERETSDPTPREIPIPKPRHRKPTGFPADIDRDLYLYLKDNRPAQLSLALKDSQPNIEWKEETVHFTFSNQDAKEQFLDNLKGFKYEIVPVNPVLAKQGLSEEIKEIVSVFSSGKSVSFIERYNEGFIKLVGRAVSTFDLAIDEVKKCIDKVEERTSRHEDVIEILPVHLKLLRKSTRFQRLENSLKGDGCEIQLEDTNGRITVKGSQAQIQKLKDETQDIVGRFGERSLKQSKFSLLKTPKGISHAKTLFPTENLMVEVNDQGNVMLYGMDQTQVQQAYNTIENAVGELKLPPSLRTKSSQDALLNELGASIPLTLQTEEGQPRIICFKKHLQNLSGKVDDFLERKKTVEKRVPLDKVVLRYLRLHGGNLFEGLHQSLLGLSIKYDSDALIVSGESPLVDNCCATIHNFTRGLMLESVNYGTHETSGSISEVTSMPIIQSIERKHQCAIVVTTREETDGRSSFNAPPTSPVDNLNENRKRTLQCRYTTSPSRKIIEIHQGDILNHPVHYLVNSANEEMKHSGGLAKAIVDKGGRKIQTDSFRARQDRGRDKLLPGEVVITDGGSLMCRKIIHVVTSKCSSTLLGSHEGETKEGKHLRRCCTDVLMNARDGQTIAIPALGTGIYSVPHDVSAKSLVTAAYEFLQENPSHALREVHFVDNNPAAIEALMKEMTTRFGHDPNFQINELVGDRWRSYLGAASVTPPSAPVVSSGDMAFKTPEGMEIRLTVGNIAKSTTDVIVNTVGSDLNLTKNPSSKAILDEAGSVITSYCEKWIRDHGQVQEGKFAITDGGMLKCKKVLHVSCPSWTADHGEKNLRELTQKLLAQVQTLYLTSISIPALGTGRLKFPDSLVAKVLIEEAMKFSSKHSSSLKIRQCNIVVYDENTKAVYTFREKFQIYSKTKNENRFNVAKIEHKTVDFLKPAVNEEAESSEDETHGVNVEIIHGDIVEQSTDAIGFLVEEDITQGGQIGAALLKAAGGDLVKEYSKLGKIEAGTIVMTGAGNLKARCLFHMVIKNTALKTGKSIQDAVTNCLNHADLCGCTSLSLPAVGTGHLKKDAKQSAEILHSCIKEYRKRNEKSLKLIRIVLFQENVFMDFNKAFACKDPSTMSADSREGTPQTRQQITLEIAAKTLSDITKVKEELRQVVKPNF